ncbi:hypothetical protein [Kitasatospora sp. MAP5-34]|uniref:hypothetical protein n=1 Tax=Kitasatospora sp. MAP5-34 TaxID=3035102 RepID=UPI0024749F17|nr:hypothetical protein [Kitasatospora sp. MAP5-34]MDH6574587.1 hypothetical protein [Kitasatospora sp. MAP5-34]
MSQSAVGSRIQPWFGGYLDPPTATAEEIRTVQRHEIRDIGHPHQEYLPAAPFLLPRSSYAELFRAADVMAGLVHRTALEAGPTTAQRMAAFGATDQDYPLFLADSMLEERYASCLVRPDIVIGPTGPQFLELNISGGFAGTVESHCGYAAWRALYGAAGEGLPFTHHDPFAARADLFDDVCEELALPRRLAWVGALRESVLPIEETRYFDLETDYLHSRGFDAEYVEVEDADQLWDCAPQDRYPLGLRHFNVADLSALGIGIEPVRRALDGGCLLLSTQTSGFLGNKMALGLLSEGRPWMSAAEHAFVERYLPWTRVLTDRRTSVGSTDVQLLPYAVENQEDLVVKRGIGSNGRQVVIGRETDVGTWRETVESAAAAGTSVVQRFVPIQSTWQSVLTDALDVPETVPVAPVISPLLFGRRPAGAFTRFFADNSAGIISVASRSAMSNVVVTR